MTPASNVPRYCSAAMALFGRFIIMMKAGICGARLFHCIFRFMQQTNCLTQHCCLGFTGCLLCRKSHWRCQVSGMRSWVSQTLCNEKIHTHTHTKICTYYICNIYRQGERYFLQQLFGLFCAVIAEIKCKAAPDHLVSPVYPEVGSADHYSKRVAL